MVMAGDRWGVVSGGGGGVGGGVAGHFGASGRPVLGLDQTFETAAPAPGVVARTVDLLLEADVRQALADTIPASEPIALLVNAVGLIWNEPVLALRGARFATHSLATWR